MSGESSHVTVTLTARWDLLPAPIVEQVLSHVSLSDLLSCSLVCRKWANILRDEKCDVWRVQCLSRLSKQILKSDVLSSLTSYKAKLRAYYYAWDSNDCSKNIYIKPNGFTLHRNPVAQSQSKGLSSPVLTMVSLLGTDAAKGKVGFITGRHCWEVWWEGPLGV